MYTDDIQIRQKTKYLENLKQTFPGFISFMMSDSIPIMQSTLTQAKPVVTETSAAPSGELNKKVLLSRGYLRHVLESVAVEWKPLRNCRQCPCGSSLEGIATTKTHCRRCGKIFCKRCTLYKVELVGDASHRPKPVCNACHKNVSNIPNQYKCV